MSIPSSYASASAIALAAAGLALAVPGVSAQLAISANDNKVVLVDGVTTVVRPPRPDTITLLDIGAVPIRTIGEVEAPASVVGPPSSVAITPDRTVAIVTNSMKVDPANPSRTIPDDTVTVIGLGPPLAVLATLRAGAGANGVAINPAGTLALVANRHGGSVSVFAIKGRTVTPAGTVDLGAPDSWPSGVAFARDGRRAFVTRNNDHLVSVLTIDGDSVRYDKLDFATSLKPYGIGITPSGTHAVVAHIGAGATGGADVLTLVDLQAARPRAVSHVTAGPTIEALSISPNGLWVAATVMNGSNLPRASPFHHEVGQLRIFSLTGDRLEQVAEAPSGRWCQGLGWTDDSTRLVVQCAADRALLTYSFEGRKLAFRATQPMSGGPVGFATSRK